MPTFGDLQSQVASDLRRSNLGNEIRSSILDAIQDHGGERFFFNETRNYTFPLVIAQDEYQLPAIAPVAEFIHIDWIYAQIGSVWVRLTRDPSEDIEEIQTTPSSGQPMWWAWYGNRLRIYPTPNQAYPLRIGGHYRLIELGNDLDSNDWTNAAKNLIRYSALKRLYAYPIRDADQRQVAEGAEALSVEYLRRDTDRRKRRGRMQAYYG